MACQVCNTIPGLPAASVSVNYPTSPQKSGDFFDITVVTTAGVLTIGTYMVCLYESNVLVDTESFWIQFGGSVTTVFTVKMASKDMKFNVSGINVGLIWDSCDQFELFTVYSQAPPTPTKYNCVSGVCQGPFLTGTFDSSSACIASGCSPPPPGGGGKCASDQINLFGSCYKKNDVMIATGAGILLFMMMRQ